MDHHKRTAAFTRRGFLKTVGALTGAIMLPVAGARVAKAGPKSGRGVSARMGLLLPDAALHPTLPQSFTAGLQLLAEQTEAVIDLIPETIDASPSSVVAKAQRLLDQDAPDLVVAVANPSVVTHMAPIFEASSTPLIVIDGGANVSRTSEFSPGVFHHSLGYWRANWAMGEWAVKHMGPKVFVVSSLYESGYDSLHAFRLGVESAGGSVVGTKVTHIGPQPVDWGSVYRAIQQERPDFVYALYSGAEAVEFLQSYALAGSPFPVAGSPSLVDEATLAKLGRAALGIRSCLPWAPELPTLENQAFAMAYQQVVGKPPDPFALLGYETAQLVVEALQAQGGVRQALESARVVGPRGQLRMHAATRSVTSPLYLREVRRGDTGLVNAVVGVLNPPDELAPGLQELRTCVRSGWTNPYLLA